MGVIDRGCRSVRVLCNSVQQWEPLVVDPLWIYETGSLSFVAPYVVLQIASVNSSSFYVQCQILLACRLLIHLPPATIEELSLVHQYLRSVPAMRPFHLLLIVLTSRASAVLITYTSYKTITAVGTTSTIYESLPISSVTVSGASPTSTGVSPQWIDDSFQSTILNSTNTYRKQHNATALTWNDTLATYAAEHVTPCRFAHTHGPYGENLAEGYQNVTAAVEGWGDERKEYNFDSGGFGEQTGHFTQLVWKNTRSTGCGRQDCGDKGWLLFCEYWPPGNVEGAYTQNVQSELKDIGGQDESALEEYVQYIHEKTGSASGSRRAELALCFAATVIAMGILC